MISKYIISIILLPLIDIIYLKSIGGEYNKMIKNIQGEDIEFNISYAVLCWICLLGLLNYFIIKDNKHYLEAFLLGLGIYGVYEFTNGAILKKWELWSIIIDTLWGGIFFSLVTLLTYTLDKVINKQEILLK